MPTHACTSCGEQIGNHSKRCRFCGVGEVRPHSNGYRRIYDPDHPLAMRDGYVLEHRWLLHKMAIPIPQGWHVHHRNGNKSDNWWSNLEVLPASEHLRGHVREAGVVTNQYGVFPVLTDPEARRQRLSEWNRQRLDYKREWRRRKEQQRG